MEVRKIIVTDLITSGNLFTEEGYDLGQSADNLADLKSQVIMGYLEEHYPEVEICADIAIQKEARGIRPLEVLAYSAEGEVIPAASDALRELLSARIAEAIADNTWAVKAS
ncbi:hypothetical protein [Desulfobulbus propionicus]|jgi:stage III sporulation protein SpoIIIAA